MHIRLNNVRISYPHLFTPRAVARKGAVPAPDAKQRYSAAFIIDANDPQMAEITKARAAVIAEKYPDGKLPYGFRDLPIVKGEEKYPGDPNYAGKLVINASNLNKPGVVDENALPVTDAAKVYAGCIVNCYLSIFSYNNQQVGVTIGLEAVQFVKDGPRLDGRPAMDNLFAPVEMDSAPVDLGAATKSNPWE